MIKKAISKLWAIALPLTVIVAAAIIHVSEPLLLNTLRLNVFDSYQRLQPREYEPLPITIIDIDEASLKKLGQWPWPRNMMATLTDRLAENGVAALGLDVVFAESDRTSPKALLPKWQDFIAKDAITNTIPDHDALFADAIKRFNVVSGVVLTDATSTLPTKKFGLVVQGDNNPKEYVFPYDGALDSLAIFTQAAAGNGALNSVPDHDGLIRKVPLLLRVGDALHPTLSAETLRIAQGASTYVLSVDEGGIQQLRIGELAIPTDKHGHVWVHYTPYAKERYIPAWEILADGFDASRLEGHIVLLGTSAAGLKDIRTTPLNPVTNGVEIHVQAMEQMLLGHFLSRPDWINAAEFLYMVIAALLVWLLLALLSPYVGAVCTLLLLGGSAYGSWIAFSDHRLLVDPVSPGIAIVMLYLVESLRRYIGAEKERQQVRHAFSHYMSPALVEQLARQPDALSLGGEMKDMTVLFCDIRGFTAISEQFDAQELTQFINQFLTPMTNIILERQGTIDKYMGDCIMAFWNAPLDDPHHGENGCRAALEMVKALEAWNIARELKYVHKTKTFIPVRIGIGLNSDACCVGNMGSDQRFDYSVLGDGVNLASRLEGQSKQYGMTIVIGEQTHKAIQGFATIELDLIMVKGKTEAVHIYGLLGDEELSEKAAWQDVEDANSNMLTTYRAQDWETALCWLEKLTTLSNTLNLGLEGYITLYQTRIADYQHMPPPEDWDGVFVATSK